MLSNNSLYLLVSLINEINIWVSQFNKLKYILLVIILSFFNFSSNSDVSSNKQANIMYKYKLYFLLSIFLLKGNFILYDTFGNSVSDFIILFSLF